MKKVTEILLMLVVVVISITSVGVAQVAQDSKLNVRAVSEGSILVGQNSIDSRTGPYFGGSIAYGLGTGASLYIESGYGWTGYQSVDGLKLISVPILGGVTYDFGPVLKSEIIRPYVGASGGLF